LIQSCKPVVGAPTLIKGSLLSPVPITPSESAGPPGNNATACKGKSPSWELTSAQYNKRVMHHKEGAATSESLFVQLTNKALGYSANCAGYFTQTPGAQSMQCTGQEVVGMRKERYQILTEAKFDPSTVILTVNQTWYCSENESDDA
jgi:hypothetical protein